MRTTATKRELRASAAPLYWDCPAAAHDEGDEILINPVDDAGTLGSAVHAACADLVTKGDADLGCIGQTFGLSEKQMEDLRIMYYVATKFWEEYGDQFGKVVTEFPVCSIDGRETGHIDVVSRFSESCSRILDWKTTRLEAVNYHAQMMEYLWLLIDIARSRLVGDERFQYILGFLRDRTIEVSKEFTINEIDAWHSEYIARVDGWDGRTYNPSGKCVYCPRRTNCPGLRSELGFLADAYNLIDDKIVQMKPNDQISLWEAIGMSRNIGDHARDILKMLAEAAGGKIQGDGKVLILREKSKQNIKAREAWPVMVRNGLSETEIAQCVSVTKGKLLDAIGDKAPPRGKGRAKAMFMDELEAAGAVDTTTYTEARIVAALPETVESELSE